MAERDSVNLASQLDLLTFTFDLLASDLKTDRQVTRGVIQLNFTPILSYGQARDRRKARRSGQGGPITIYYCSPLYCRSVHCTMQYFNISESTSGFL